MCPHIPPREGTDILPEENHPFCIDEVVRAELVEIHSAGEMSSAGEPPSVNIGFVGSVIRTKTWEEE
jgi:hypothetical protein